LHNDEIFLPKEIFVRVTQTKQSFRLPFGQIMP